LNSSCLPVNGTIFLKSKSIGGRFLRRVQSFLTLTMYGVPSIWNHVVLKIGMFIYESNIIKVRNGTKRFLFWRVKKWKKIRGVFKTYYTLWCQDISRKKYICVGIQDQHKITIKEWAKIRSTAEYHVKSKTGYPLKELAGVLRRIIKYNFTPSEKREELMSRDNIYNGSGEVCVAFVTLCIESPPLYYMDINRTVSVVDEIWIDSKLPCRNTIIKL